MVYGGQGADADKLFVFEPAKLLKDQSPQSFSRIIEPGVMFQPLSWSPDGTQLLGNAEPRGGIFTFSFASRRFTRLSDVGYSQGWLNDSRRALMSERGKLLVLDSVSKDKREILTIAPDEFDSVALSADNHTIYFTREIRQGDIWLMTMK